jgi:uncharacterized protein (DUF952 family)
LNEYWKSFDGRPEYYPESLSSEGFVHCSFEEQLDAVLERYYADAENVLLLEIEPDQLKSELKIEPSTNDELYPHIYGPINRDAIVSVKERALKSKKERTEAQSPS